MLLAAGATTSASFAFACALLVIACATGTGSTGLGDGEGGVFEEGGTRDVNVLPTGDSGGGGDTGTVPGDDASTTGCTEKVVINELKADGDELVELFNPNTCAVLLGNWELKYASAGGGAGGAGYKFAAGDSIKAKGHFVIANGSIPKDATLATGLAADNGQVGLLDDSGKLVDAVAYGSVTAGPYREAQSAPKPPANGSIGRNASGADTDDNRVDFKTLTSPSPGAAN